MAENRDWTGNKATAWVTLGAHNMSSHERDKHDYYATDPRAAVLLLQHYPQLDNIYECAAGEAHLSHVFDMYGKLGKASDLVVRSVPMEQIDFLQYNEKWHNGDIVTNPPYKYARQFVEHALDLVDEGRYVCMFLRLAFLESQGRYHMFKKIPPKEVLVSAGRINCGMNGEFNRKSNSAVPFAWFVWQKGFTGKPTLDWIL